MENEVDLSSGNPLDLTPKGPLAGENLALPTGPDLSSTPNLGPGSSPLYPGKGQGMFGSNRLMIKPNAETNPLDNAEKLLTADRDKLQGAAANPIVQFLWRDEAKQMSEEAAKKSLEIQDIQQKRQTQQTNQAMARNMGLTRAMAPTADAAAIGEEALREWRENGNYDAYRGMHGAGMGARADLYMDEGVNALGKKTEAAKSAVDRLNSATTQAEYNSIRKDILSKSKDGSHEFSSLGMDENNVPKYQTEWKDKRGAITAKLNNASATVETFNQKQASLSQAVPITDEKIAKAVTEPLQMSNGETFPNIKAHSLPGAGGAQGGLAQPGSKDIANYGVDGGWRSATPAQAETLTKQIDAEQVKGAVGRYKIAKDFATYANDDRMYTYSAGLAALNDKFGGVERNIAEGSKGSGNIGLTKQLERQYGIPEHLANEVMKARSELRSYFDNGAKGPLPKLSPQSIEGMKYIANVGLNNTKGEFDRLSQPIETAGRYGIPINKLGLDTEIQNDPLLKDVHSKALAQARLDYDRYPAIIKGDRRVILPQDAKVPGMIPAGSYASTLPKVPAGDTGNALPLVPANPAAPRSNTLSSGASGPASGISQDYLIKTAKVESRSNWTEGNNLTSASGAFQFTNKTWNENKPEGAPNRAAEATPQQQTEAARKLTESNAKVLARNDIPVNDTNAYIAHNLGASGAVKFIGARDDAKARAVVGEEAAKNNPTFFKGDPTVAEAKARYAQVMQGTAQPTAEQIANYNATREGAAAVKAKMAQSATTNAANIAPALGAVAGMPLGPAGTIAGGAAGGAVRQAFNGGPGYVDQMARGAAQAIPAAIPGVGPLATAGRVVAAGAVPAAEKLYDTGGQDVGGAIEAGTVGAISGAAGEAFGRALGMGGHKIFSHLATASQAEAMAAAKVLATQEPKIADAAGKMVPNKAYEQAEQFVKDRGLDVEHAAYAYNVSKAGVPKGEALAQRPGAIEAAKAGKEYDAIKDDMAAAASTMSKNITPRNVQGGPTSLVRDASNPTGTVPAKYIKDAEDAQLRVTAPAKTWDAKWNQLGEARSDLLKKERDALASTAADKGERAEAMRALADSVRVQQEKVALHVLGATKGKAAIARLEQADVRYRNAMTASGDGDIVKAIAQGGAEGRKAQAAFDALAANDPTAQRMVRSLVAMSKSKLERSLSTGATALSAAVLYLHVPIVGTAAAATLSTIKAQQMLRDYMAKRGAGAPVKLKDMLVRENGKGYAARAGSVIGSQLPRVLIDTTDLPRQ